MLPKSALHGRHRPAWPLIRFILPVFPFRIFWWLRFPSMALSFAMLLVNMVWAFCPWELAPAAVVGSHSDQVCAFIQLLENLRSRVLCIWISPDASTTSRARDRRLKGLRHGGPKQLRSSAHPAGVPGLSFGHKRRTELSNQAFDAVLQVAPVGCSA